MIAVLDLFPGVFDHTHLAASPINPPPFEVLVVITIVVAALVLFLTQPVPIDATAIGLMVALMILGPWTGVSLEDGLSGFSNPATLTVLAMFVLSEGVRQTGAIQILTRKLSVFAGGSETRQLLATLGLAGPTAGFVNNTPIVAILIPAVTDLARRSHTSPSKLLIPLSFVAMLGGMLTVIGTSTNLLASQVWAQVGGPDAQPYSMFEFTQLGAIVLLVGIVYLLTIGRVLTPARIEVDESPTDAFGMTDYLTDVVVGEDSHIVGKRVRDVSEEDLDVNVVRITRGERSILHGLRLERIRAGDVMTIRADQETLQRIIEDDDLRLLPDLLEAIERGEADVPDDLRTVHHPWTAASSETRSPAEAGDESVAEDRREGEIQLVEIVLLPGPWSRRLNDVHDFQREYDVPILAIRRGSEVLRERLQDVRLREGDVLLVQTTDDVLERLRSATNVVVSSDVRWEEFDRSKIPIAIGIVAAVVVIAAIDILPIVVSALAGVVAMVFTGILQLNEAYDAIDWKVIFLLAGVIPLGIAFETSGTAALFAEGIILGSAFVPAVVLLAVFYLGTALITEVVSNTASVVLMIPIAVEVATRLGLNAFAFALAVTFAASTPLLTPVGYQTNLMVYGPGGYRFSDYFRVGAPLQLVLTLVTTLGIVYFWGL